MLHSVRLRYAISHAVQYRRPPQNPRHSLDIELKVPYVNDIHSTVNITLCLVFIRIRQCGLKIGEQSMPLVFVAQIQCDFTYTLLKQRFVRIRAIQCQVSTILLQRCLF